MNHSDESVLDKFRAFKRCEFCKRETPKGCDPAHILTRGAGQVDIPGNIIALCRWCHMHQGMSEGPSVEWMKRWASNREALPWEEIEARVMMIRRKPQPRGDRIEKPLVKKPKKLKPAWYLEAKKKQSELRKKIRKERS